MKENICDICEYTAYTKKLLKKHLLNHKAKKFYTCDICNYNNLLQCRIKYHKTAVHIDKKIFKCDVIDCKFSTSREFSLNRHKKKHNFGKSKKNSDSGFESHSENNSESHSENHYESKDNILDLFEKTQMYKCTEFRCKFSTNSNYDMFCHEELHKILWYNECNMFDLYIQVKCP